MLKQVITTHEFKFLYLRTLAVLLTDLAFVTRFGKIGRVINWDESSKATIEWYTESAKTAELNQGIRALSAIEQLALEAEDE